MSAPKAKKIPHFLKKFDDERVDNYYWLNQRDNSEVINYLNQENAYTKYKLQSVKSLKSHLFEEMKGRLKKDDDSVPYKMGDYFYYHRFEKEKEYRIYCRKKHSLDAPEEIVLNVNKLAQGHDFFQVKSVRVTSDHSILGYALDTVGRRNFKIKFINLKTKTPLDYSIEGTSGNWTFANNNTHVFTSIKNAKTLRSYAIERHNIISQTREIIFEEKDETFNTWVYRSLSNRYIFIVSHATLTTEYRIIDANNPTENPVIFTPRRRGHEYAVAHGHDAFYILSNHHAKNFKVMKSEIANTNEDSWQEIIPHSPEIYLESISAFRDFIAISQRKNGLSQIRIFDPQEKTSEYIKFTDATYVADLNINKEFNTKSLRFSYESMNTPYSIYDYNISSKKQVLKKQQEVLLGFDAKNYVTERVYATAGDGVKIPVSMVYKKGLVKNGTNPTLIYGYGSYGYSMEPYFNTTRISLLDRGFIFAIAHIRGGSEMGRSWYDNGKLLKKKNTFSDFIAATEYLVASHYTSPAHLYALGGSAGGLLMGAVLNMRPDLYNGVISAVPFVDVVTTMLDESIPLTTGEYDEWGNPNEKEYYHYIKSYSPYDNIERKPYPNLLVTTGFHDSQVQYFEPAKWVAKLRDYKTDKNTLLLYTEMDTGHSGTTGRYKSLELSALWYAFIIGLESKRL